MDPCGVRSICGVHNYAFNAEAMLKVSSYCKERIVPAKSNPMQFGFMLVGDFNIEAETELVFSLVSPQFQKSLASESTSTIAVSNTALNSWKHIFSLLTEVVFPAPSLAVPFLYLRPKQGL